ncbi:MAG: site-specific integrase, partial [Bacteroidetes bacterium]|nr:site-specific integrase [Bacteroidota bacterium]
MSIKGFISYLEGKHAPSTVSRYVRETDRFFISLESKETSPKTATYSDVMDYVGELRKKYKNGSTINCSLAAI